MATEEYVAERLDKKNVPKIYTRLLSICALVEELAENGGGIAIGTASLMREHPTTAAYVSFGISILSFLIETGRMLAKIHCQFDKHACRSLGNLLVMGYRRIKWVTLCCGILFKVPENEPYCCLCPLIIEEVNPDDVEMVD